MTAFVLLVPLALLAIASWHDLRTREIPDWIAILLVLTAVVAAALGLANIRWWMVLAGGALGLGVGFLLFRYANFGGGDAKLLAAVGALLGPVGLMFLLFWMALAGGVLALVALLRGQRDYAYGPAIAAGYAAYLVYPAGVWKQWL